MSGLEALVQKAELADCSALLRSKGYEPVALKGAFLAWHAYPQPAQRPLRDLDVLVPDACAIEAFKLLLDAGYTPAYEANIPLEDCARFSAHMPALVSPRGCLFELHMRLSELDGMLEYRTPEGNEAEVIRNSLEIGGLRFPTPDDMLRHLVIHAIYGHRLDCGPLLLTDVYHLVRNHHIDWTAFWRAARRGGWEPGARLVVELVRIYHGESAVPSAGNEPAAPATKVVELAKDLLLQNPDNKKTARFAATILTGGIGTVFKRMTGRLNGKGQRPMQIDRSREGGAARWAIDQLRFIIGEFSDPEVRSQSLQLARFKRWLER
jgi:hypothetical protein